MEMVDIDVDQLVRETDAAWLFIIAGEGYWLPKSQCTFDGDDRVCVPEWLAIEKGLA